MTRTPDRVCVVGSSNVDLTFYAAQLPAPGETRLGAEFRWGGGGKGANQAVAAARVGAETAFVTKVGDDFFGAHLKATYRREGLPAEFVLTDDQAATGAAAILVDGAGQNQILVA
ncbi:MAG TPA: PfkB family carbohydrate kinase, partial [Pirellulales bacterium]